MPASLLADLVVLIHFAFVLFVVLGGLLVVRWPKVAWLHLPCALWGAGIEFAGSVCPLTPLENELRRRAGQAGYEGGFVEQYILPVLYPHQLTRETQLILGLSVIVINLALYTWAVRSARRRRAETRGEAA
jgi:hypothetical protein